VKASGVRVRFLSRRRRPPKNYSPKSRTAAWQALLDRHSWRRAFTRLLAALQLHLHALALNAIQIRSVLLCERVDKRHGKAADQQEHYPAPNFLNAVRRSGPQESGQRVTAREIVAPLLKEPTWVCGTRGRTIRNLLLQRSQLAAHST
jgi:hypothetical protein